jgi:hypothetical protein
LSYGLKTEGSFIFRNEVDATTDTGKFKRFSTGLSIGPYIKFEIASMWTVGAEVSLDPTTYHQDQYVSSDSKRTGTGYSGTAYVQHSRGGKYFNPYLSAKFTQDNAKGSEYKATSYKFSLNSPMKVLPKLEVVPSVAYSVTEYYKRTSGIRNDALLDILLQANYQLALKWTLLGSIGITANSSNIPDSYSYDRQLLTIGVSYSVF